MDYELIFSVAGLLAMFGWATLLISPLIPTWSNRIAGWIVPILLSAGYVIIAFLPNDSGGYGSFNEISQLFSQPAALMAGWIHFLAFDLLIGSWICRTARRDSISYWMVAPTLPITFLFGPAGFLVFSVVRALNIAARR